MQEVLTSRVDTDATIPPRARNRLANLVIQAMVDLTTLVRARQPLLGAVLKLKYMQAMVLATKRGRKAESGDANMAWRHIRRKLQLAEAGQWRQLALELKAIEDEPGIDQEIWLPPADLGEIAQATEEATRREMAAIKVLGGCTRTASKLLKGEGMLPPAEQTFDAVAKLIVQEITAKEYADKEGGYKISHCRKQKASNYRSSH
jgi:hypothetical protein